MKVIATSKHRKRKQSKLNTWSTQEPWYKKLDKETNEKVKKFEELYNLTNSFFFLKRKVSKTEVVKKIINLYKRIINTHGKDKEGWNAAELRYLKKRETKTGHIMKPDTSETTRSEQRQLNGWAPV